MNSSEWTDRQKWIMGIVASLTIVAVTAIGAQLFSKLGNKQNIVPFSSGVDLLSIPQLKNNAAGRIEAIHKPKGYKNLSYRYYDVYLANLTNEPLTLVSAIVDTQLITGLGELSGEGDPVFPNITYMLTYHPSRKRQQYPLQQPFRIKPKGVGSLRLRLVPNNSIQFLSDSLEMNIRLVDALGGEYYVIKELQ